MARVARRSLVAAIALVAAATTGRFGPGGFRRWLDGGAVLSSNHGTGAIPAHAAALCEITARCRTTRS